MKILITAANSPLGRVLSDHFGKQDFYKVIKTVRKKLSGDFLKCDVTKHKDLEEIILSEKPDIIFHLAASHTGQFEKDYQVNTLSAKSIFDIILNKKLKSRVILIGSASEYGIVKDEDNPISEEQVLKPATIYGLTKSYQTLLGQYYAQKHGLDIVIARIFNLDIPGLSDRLFIGNLQKQIELIEKGESSEIKLGDLSSIRDYIGEEQLIDQINKIMTKGISGEVYNIGSGKPTKLETVIQNKIPYKINIKNTKNMQYKRYNIYSNVDKLNSI